MQCWKLSYMFRPQHKHVALRYNGLLLNRLWPYPAVPFHNNTLDTIESIFKMIRKKHTNKIRLNFYTRTFLYWRSSQTPLCHLCRVITGLWFPTYFDSVKVQKVKDYDIWIILKSLTFYLSFHTKRLISFLCLNQLSWISMSTKYQDTADIHNLLTLPTWSVISRNHIMHAEIFK